MPQAQLISGGKAILERVLDIAAAPCKDLAYDAFRISPKFGTRLGKVIHPDTELDLIASACKDSRKMIKAANDGLPSDANFLEFGSKDGTTFSHAKSISNGQEAMVMTASQDKINPNHLDWGLSVEGPQAQAIVDVNNAIEAGQEDLIRAAIIHADEVGVHYNDPTLDLYFATKKVEGALKAVKPGDEVDFATKEVTDEKMGKLIANAFDNGAEGEVVHTRELRKDVNDLLTKVDVPTRATTEAKIHGSLYVFDDELILGTMYLAPRPTGRHHEVASREILISTREPEAVAQARAAIANIK